VVDRSIWRIGAAELRFPPSLAVGIVNVTTDSFFSGARSGTPEQALEDGLALVDQGFDLLDVGALAARSGPALEPAEEAARLVPAIERLAASAGVPITADTFSVEVARAALEAGAVAINDIGGAQTEMLELVAQSGCGYILMHIEGPPRVDRPAPVYEDPVDHIRAWFRERIDAALALGVSEDQIALDPGLDFDLTVDDDLEILRRLGELRSLGRPLFLALSRKDFLGAVLAGSWEARVEPERREAASLAATALAVADGAELLRIHDRSALDALRVAERIARPVAADV
jgi:dihydropteroate synthase